MAKFTVTTHNGAAANYEGRYWVDEGVLTVQPDKGNKIYFSTIGWLVLEVEEADPHVT